MARAMARHLGWELVARASEGSVIVTLTVQSTVFVAPVSEGEIRQLLPAREREDRVHRLLVEAGPLSARQVQRQLGMRGSTVRETLNSLVATRRAAHTEEAASSPKQSYVAIADQGLSQRWTDSEE